MLYTDAYFVLNGVVRKPGDTNRIPGIWNEAKCCQYENRWGYVIHYMGTITFASGMVPPKLIRKFCTRKAYIYFLETLAQLLALLCLTEMIPK